MSFAVLIEVLEYNRQKTQAFIDTLAKHENLPQILGWRAGPGRAHIAWQLMHIAATDDRHVHVRMQGGQPQAPEYVRRFAGGSTPDDDIPSLEEIRRYLDAQRQELLSHLRKLDDSALTTKPNEQAPWTYQEWLKVLSWHEAHHQGQAHLAFNLYRAAHGLK
jgi:uncharacterized damage-inducible protein DinB